MAGVQGRGLSFASVAKSGERVGPETQLPEVKAGWSCCPRNLTHGTRVRSLCPVAACVYGGPCPWMPMSRGCPCPVVAHAHGRPCPRLPEQGKGVPWRSQVLPRASVHQGSWLEGVQRAATAREMMGWAERAWLTTQHPSVPGSFPVLDFLGQPLPWTL